MTKKTISKEMMVDFLSEITNFCRCDVEVVFKGVLDEIKVCLRSGYRIEIRNFGIFDVVERKRKIGRYPENPSIPIIIPKKLGIRFKAAKLLKRKVEKSTG